MPLPKGRNPNYFNQPVAKAYNPTLRDKAAGLLSGLFGDTYQTNLFSRGLLGSSGLGGGQGPIAGMGLLDMTPLGAAFALEEAGRKIGRGDRLGGAADAALAVVPIPAAARVAKGGAKAMARRVAPKAGKRMAAVVPVSVPENLFVSSVPAPERLDMSYPARMRRAADQGFDTQRPFYHATGQEYQDYDFARAGSGANAGLVERAAFLSDNPAVSETYLGQQWINGASDDIERITGQRRPGDVVTIYNDGSNVRPYYIKPEGMTDWEFYGGGYRPPEMTAVLRDAKKDRASGALLNNVRDQGMFGFGMGTPSTVAVVTDPNAMRSIFDLFEPPRKTTARRLPDGQSRKPAGKRK